MGITVVVIDAGNEQERRKITDESVVYDAPVLSFNDLKAVFLILWLQCSERCLFV